MDNKGYYKILGLSPGASDNEVKRAYSRKIMEYHPDQGKTTKKVKAMPDGPEKESRLKELEDKIRKLNEAKNVLSDPDKKKMYDQGYDDSGPAGFDMGGFDIFDFMGGGRQREAGQKKVADTEFRVKFSLKDCFLGRKKTFNVKREVVCQKCTGRGGKDSTICKKCNGKGEYQVKRQMGFIFAIDQQKCDSCHGLGSIIIGPVCTDCKGHRYVNKTESISVEFKKGFQNGETLVVKGKGDEHVGAIAGDLVLIAQVENDPHFRRIGDHLVVKTDIDLCTALTGGVISLRNIDGNILNITIEKMQNLREDVYTIRNGGFPGGNLYVEPNFITNKINVSELKKYNTFIKPPTGGRSCVGTTSKMPTVQQKSRESKGFKDSVFSSFFGGF